MLKYILTVLLVSVISIQSIAQGPPPGTPGGDPELTKEQMAKQITDVRDQAQLAFDTLVQIKDLASDKILDCINLKLDIQIELNNYTGSDKEDLVEEFTTLKDKLTSFINEYNNLKTEYDTIVEKFDEAEDQVELFVFLQQEKLWRPCGLLAITLYTSAETDCTDLKSKYLGILTKATTLYLDLYDFYYRVTR